MLYSLTSLNRLHARGPSSTLGILCLSMAGGEGRLCCAVLCARRGEGRGEGDQFDLSGASSNGSGERKDNRV